jgi:hypothetical protein
VHVDHFTMRRRTTAPASLASRGLRPAAELAAGRAHGDRLRYIAGCRCNACRGANTAYERARAAARRAGDWNGLVDALTARRHLATLSAAGVGRRTVGEISGVADSILSSVITGRKQSIRARTERAILAVTEAAKADHALLDAAPTWRLLDSLLAQGYTKAALARALGQTRAALQISRHQVTVRTAYAVERLHAQLRTCDAGPTLSLIAELREEGYRQALIERELAALAQELGRDAPDLTVLGDRRIRVDAADLVQRLYAKLTS